MWTLGGAWKFKAWPAPRALVRASTGLAAAVLSTSGCAPTIAKQNPEQPPHSLGSFVVNTASLESSEAKAHPHADATHFIKGELFIQPYGKVPNWQLATARKAIEDMYGFTVTVLPQRPLPSAAYHPPRRRYRAEKLLDDLDAHAPTPNMPMSRVLGMTTRDISTSKDGHADWGIFGLGRLPGRSAVVSSRRLRPKMEASPARRRKWVQRIRVLAVHEVGHTLGLAHCTEEHADCPMRSAGGSAKLADHSKEALGPSCAAKIAAHYDSNTGRKRSASRRGGGARAR